MRTMITALIFFTLLAVAGGCGNDANPTSLAKTFDSSPPATPTSFQAAAGPSLVKLDWAPNTADNDFLGYRVYRMIDGRAVLLSAQLLTVPQFIDHHPWPTAMSYAVTAVDMAGNESAYQTVIFVPHGEQPLRTRD